MSYVRKGDDSDVYVIRTLKDGEEYFWCMGCSLCENGINEEFTRGSMLEHLAQHIKMGHKVPDRAIARLFREIAESVTEEIRIYTDVIEVEC